MAKAYGFSEEFARRISRVVHRAEGTGPQHPPVPVGQPRGETVYWVKCTHDVATVINAKNYFPAAVQSYDNPTNAFTNLPGGICWLTAPNDLALSEKIYPAWHVAYVYNASGYLPVFLTIDITGAAGPAGSLEVKEVDGSPDVTDVTVLSFDQTDGFTVSDLTGGSVQIDMVPASVSQIGVVNKSAQAFKGMKTFTEGIQVEQYTVTIFTGTSATPATNDWKILGYTNFSGTNPFTGLLGYGCYTYFQSYVGATWTYYNYLHSWPGGLEIKTVSGTGGLAINGNAGISGTVTLAKITPGGANGSLTITGGIITAKTDPT